MATTNNWLNPFQRSFGEIKSQIIQSLKLNAPEITDFSEGNIFIRIISIVAAIAEVLHYYIDNVARETFFITARKYSSLIKHAKMVDYRVKSANPSSVDIVVSLSTGAPISIDLVIPAGTEFTSQEGIVFLTQKPKTWLAGTYSIRLSAKQVDYINNVSLGNILSEDMVITLGNLGSGNLYAEGTMVLAITKDGVTENWKMVDTFAMSKPTDKHFKVELSSTQEPVVYFGNNLNGSKPPLGSSVVASYGVTKGSLGNVPPNTITLVPNIISSQVPNAICTNKEPGSGGTNYEDFNMIKEHVPLHIRTTNIAVTAEDYAHLARLVPGVDKAFAKEACGKAVSVYITPDGGGLASEVLRDEVMRSLISKKILGTSIEVLSSRESLINLKLVVTGKPSFKSTDISKQVVNSLISKYNYNHSDIGRPVRISEIYAFLKALPMVDYLSIENLFLKPIPIPYSGAVELNFEIKVNRTSDISYLIRYDAPSSHFEIIRASGIPTNVFIPYQGELSDWVNITLDGNQWSLRVLPSDGGPYEDGNIWKFSLLKNNVDQLSPEMAIPIFKNEAQVELDIIETV